jgi:hypothetical protein
MALLFSACGGGDGGNEGSGRISFAVTDAPVDGADRVEIVFTGIALKPVGGNEDVYLFTEPKVLNLLSLQGAVSAALMDNQAIPAGRYNWARLMIDDSRLKFERDGQEFSMMVPSGAEVGLILNRGFVVDVGGQANFTIDFDLRKSVHLPENDSNTYILRPTLRIVDNASVGHVTGTVDLSLLQSEARCFNSTGSVDAAVYVYSGNSVGGDIGNADSAMVPVTTALLAQHGSKYDYAVGYLSTGTYSIALVCGASGDQPSQVDTLSVLRNGTVTVEQDKTVRYDFSLS